MSVPSPAGNLTPPRSRGRRNNCDSTIRRKNLWNTRQDKNATSETEALLQKTALKLGGKSDDEHAAPVRWTAERSNRKAVPARIPNGEQVRAHRVVWERNAPRRCSSRRIRKLLRKSAASWTSPWRSSGRHRNANTLLNENGKITTQVMQDLGRCRLLGTAGGPRVRWQRRALRQFSAVLREMAMVRSDGRRTGVSARLHWRVRSRSHIRQCRAETTILAGLGQRRTAFGLALTEPGAGSGPDRALHPRRTRGDTYFVTGEKLFITNIGCGPHHRLGVSD